MTLPPRLDNNKKTLWLSLVSLVFLITATASYVHLRSPNRGLPYRDSFTSGRSNEWKAYGGSWELDKGAMRNESDERGGKLVTGSLYWRDYSIEADVMLLGADGDAGLIIRSSDEEIGVDSYSGYYAGIRNVDNTLVLGRAEHSWVEDHVKLSAASVQKSIWYHLKILAYGCTIASTVSSLDGHAIASIFVEDKDCLPSGRAGLRSYASGGFWRNIQILPANEQELTAMRANANASEPASKKHLFEYNNSLRGFSAPPPPSDSYRFLSSPNAQSISSLKLNFSTEPTTATVRGNVSLTSPVLIVEDSTGGISVPDPELATALKVGDQVEITGQVLATDYSVSLFRATVRTLWEGIPLPPRTLNASQAATGEFDSTLIEVEGHLSGKHYGPNNTLVLDLDEGPQSFSAILSRGRGDSVFEHLKPDSRLQLRGICMTDATYTNNKIPFALLLRSIDDVTILTGPPWWSAGHLASLAIGLLLFALVINFFYHRIEHWRLRAILEERERLAHEMHDTLAQSFAGIGFQLEAIRSGVPNELPSTHQQLNLASELVRHSHEEARRSIATLRPESHGSGDLLKSLHLCAMRMVEGGNVRVTSENRGEVAPIDLRIADTLYRIGQEAIANSVRHAHPSQLMLSLDYGKNIVKLTVADNGVGYVKTNEAAGFGIRGMRKRAASISAALEIVSSPGAGTSVLVTSSLPPRITFLSWPRFLWKSLRGRQLNAESGR
jgi:hypothetical protein